MLSRLLRKESLCRIKLNASSQEQHLIAGLEFFVRPRIDNAHPTVALDPDNARTGACAQFKFANEFADSRSIGSNFLCFQISFAEKFGQVLGTLSRWRVRELPRAKMGCMIRNRMLCYLYALSVQHVLAPLGKQKGHLPSAKPFLKNSLWPMMRAFWRRSCRFIYTRTCSGDIARLMKWRRPAKVFEL